MSEPKVDIIIEPIDLSSDEETPPIKAEEEEEKESSTLSAREKRLYKKITRKAEISKKQMEHINKIRHLAYEKRAQNKKILNEEYPILKAEVEKLRAEIEDLRKPKVEPARATEPAPSQVVKENCSSKCRKFNW